MKVEDDYGPKAVNKVGSASEHSMLGALHVYLDEVVLAPISTGQPGIALEAWGYP